MGRRKRSTTGSVYAPSGRLAVYIKLFGVVIPTGYKRSAHGLELARRELERIYVAFVHQRPQLPGNTDEAKLRWWLEHVYHGRQDAPLLLSEAFQQFLDTMGPARRLKTVQNWKHAYAAFIDSDYPAAATVRQGSHDVLRIEADIERVITQRARTPVTLSNYLRAIKVFTKWMSQEGITPSDIRGPRLKRMIGTIKPKAIEIWSQEELDKLMAWYRSHSPVDALLIDLLINTGLRIHEALELTWADIDLAQRIIIVERKDGKIMQYLPLTTAVERILSQLPHDRPTLFPWKLSSTGRLRNRLETACAESGVDRKGRSFHTFRKTYISRLVDRVGNDLDAFTVSRLARARVEVIQNHYLQIPPEKLRLAAEKVTRE